MKTQTADMTCCIIVKNAMIDEEIFHVFLFHQENTQSTIFRHLTKILVQDGIKNKVSQKMLPKALHQTQPKYLQFDSPTFCCDICWSPQTMCRQILVSKTKQEWTKSTSMQHWKMLCWINWLKCEYWMMFCCCEVKNVSIW